MTTNEPWLLRKAGVARARYLFALCGDDGVNAEVAVRAAQLLGPSPGAPLTCVLHIFDRQLCALLRERELDAGSAGRLRLEFFNMFDLGARVLLEENPLAAPSPENAAAGNHLVIVGLGRLGESLLVIQSPSSTSTSSTRTSVPRGWRSRRTPSTTTSATWKNRLSSSRSR
jgi:hypothetical protein